jgi:pimeloyl-ACP methyl ester carboxylesterase
MSSPRRFETAAPVECRPQDQWGSIAVELLGTQTYFVQGRRWRHRVIEAGTSGEPLILIHGVGGHAETFARNLRNLADLGFHVYAIDALYHGLTDKEPYDDEQRYSLQVEALVDLMDALGLDSAHIEGESMGASIAFHLGLSHPERCRRIVLNTGFGNVALTKTDFAATSVNMGELKALSEKCLLDPSFETMRQRLEWVVADPASMTDEMVQFRMALYALPDVNASMRNVLRIGKQWSWPTPYSEQDCAQFKPETLVFWTEHNPGEGPDFGEYVASLLPNAWFYCMQGAAHWPQWEKPEEHDAVLVEFLLGG